MYKLCSKIGGGNVRSRLDLAKLGPGMFGFSAVDCALFGRAQVAHCAPLVVQCNLGLVQASWAQRHYADSLGKPACVRQRMRMS